MQFTYQQVHDHSKLTYLLSKHTRKKYPILYLCAILFAKLIVYVKHRYPYSTALAIPYATPLRGVKTLASKALLRNLFSSFYPRRGVSPPFIAQRSSARVNDRVRAITNCYAIPLLEAWGVERKVYKRY